MSQRERIAMTAAEQAAFLEEERTVVCATRGPRGWPHLMPLWYVVRDGELWAWTYAKSQKILNLKRDPRATLQVETGEQYQELRGVMIEAETVLDQTPETVTALGLELVARYAPPGVDEAMLRPGVEAQAPKRIAIRFVPKRTASWDHRKL